MNAPRRPRTADDAAVIDADSVTPYRRLVAELTQFSRRPLTPDELAAQEVRAYGRHGPNSQRRWLDNPVNRARWSAAHGGAEPADNDPPEQPEPDDDLCVAPGCDQAAVEPFAGCEWHRDHPAVVARECREASRVARRAELDG